MKFEYYSEEQFIAAKECLKNPAVLDWIMYYIKRTVVIGNIERGNYLFQFGPPENLPPDIEKYFTDSSENAEDSLLYNEDGATALLDAAFEKLCYGLQINNPDVVK